MIADLKANPGDPNREIVTEYFRKVGPPFQLMEDEELENLPLRFVPASKEQMRALHTRIASFAAGERAEPAFQPHLEPESKKPKDETTSNEAEDDSWRRFPMPFGKNARRRLRALAAGPRPAVAGGPPGERRAPLHEAGGGARSKDLGAHDLAGRAASVLAAAEQRYAAATERLRTAVLEMWEGLRTRRPTTRTGPEIG